MKNAWKNCNLSIVLFVPFLVSRIGQTCAGRVGFVSEPREQGQAAQVQRIERQLAGLETS